MKRVLAYVWLDLATEHHLRLHSCSIDTMRGHILREPVSKVADIQGTLLVRNLLTPLWKLNVLVSHFERKKQKKSAINHATLRIKFSFHFFFLQVIFSFFLSPFLGQRWRIRSNKNLRDSRPFLNLFSRQHIQWSASFHMGGHGLKNNVFHVRTYWRVSYRN